MPTKSKSSKRRKPMMLGPFVLTPRRIAYIALAIATLVLAGYYRDTIGAAWVPAVVYVMASAFLLDQKKEWLRQNVRLWAAAALTIPAAMVMFSTAQEGGSAGRFLTDDGNLAFVIVEMAILAVAAIIIIAPDSLAWTKKQAEGMGHLIHSRQQGHGAHHVPPHQTGQGWYPPGHHPGYPPTQHGHNPSHQQHPANQYGAAPPDAPAQYGHNPYPHQPQQTQTGAAPASHPGPDQYQQPTATPPHHQQQQQRRPRSWTLPSSAMLTPQPPFQHRQQEAAQMKDAIERTLRQYGVSATVGDVVEGPRVTRFGILPGNNVRVREVTNLQSEFALALRSSHIRVVDKPEMGSGLVWLDVPNSANNTVMLRGVVDSLDFQAIGLSDGLPMALGVDTVGQPMVMDLTAAPHLLLAGATGSGKSVCINAIITSLLLTRTPNQVRLTLVDPKRVELLPYSRIPHLAQPIITEPDAVPDTLQRMVMDMERRYDALSAQQTRNITAYNSRAPQPLPYEVLVIDELADLIMTAGKLVEEPLVRLAQLGRAAGFHVVVATQRPSVNVVTGILKANIPTRVAFAVASQVDSRVILDTNGAERLMGRGDMLVSSSTAAEPAWGHGAYVGDGEIDAVAGFWANQL